MYTFFDLMLVLPLFFLPLVTLCDRESRRIIVYTFLVSQAVLITRRITCSVFALATLLAIFVILLFIPRSHGHKDDLYIVVGKDEIMGEILLSDGRQTRTLKTNSANLYQNGKIISIKANYLSDFV